MNKILATNEGAVNSALETTLAVELFLNENYRFRRNVLNGKVEFATKPDEDWRPLTQEALNSIIRKAKKEQVCEKGSPKTEIMEFVHSEDVPVHNPIGDYLNQLPEWDGQNYIGQMFSRLPGITSEQQSYLATWLLSAVAHWLQMDTLHGNECVPTLIGAQGCGKSTFFHRLLPPELRQYYLDHLNLSNKFDKEMALTNNLLVNLDEVTRIQQLNQNYFVQKDIAEMVEVCFRKPKEGETAKLMNSKMLLNHIQHQYPSVDINHGNKVRVGQAMTSLGYESADHSNVPFYKVIPLKAA